MSERKQRFPTLVAAALLALTTLESACAVTGQASSFETNAQTTPTPLLKPSTHTSPEITPTAMISTVIGTDGSSNPTLEYRKKVEGINFGASPSPSPLISH